MSVATDVVRDQQVNLKLSPEELAKLERLAEHLAQTPQGALRYMLKRASDELEREGRWPVDVVVAPKKPRRK